MSGAPALASAVSLAASSKPDRPARRCRVDHVASLHDRQPTLLLKPGGNGSHVVHQ